jgi:hypothetical protein
MFFEIAMGLQKAKTEVQGVADITPYGRNG